MKNAIWGIIVLSIIRCTCLVEFDMISWPIGKPTGDDTGSMSATNGTNGPKTRISENELIVLDVDFFYQGPYAIHIKKYNIILYVGMKQIQNSPR